MLLATCGLSGPGVEGLSEVTAVVVASVCFRKSAMFLSDNILYCVFGTECVTVFSIDCTDSIT